MCRHGAVVGQESDLPEKDRALQAELCLAYMRGLHDMNNYAKSDVDSAKGYCFPDVQAPNMTYLVRVFVGWADKNPDKANMRAAEGVVQALRRLFPC